ncbi:TylF/MycF/NovP-related O-methyltransferase [Mucilaginibacter defluvii]|uniref:Methyltransferase family protein n=1 Tax=Mucilaginibacter defluvii TaxID=1196019 RepID=A0ABP9FW25_9SPHI
MNNYFITQKPYSIQDRKESKTIDLVNKGLRFLKTGLHIKQQDTSVDMNTVEQRINYYHLIDSVIAYNVPGEVIELGCFTGQCAILFEKVIEQNGSDKKLHLFDSFHVPFTFKGNVEEELKENFRLAGLKQPIIHKGDFKDTLPNELPEGIAFVHIDCGFGGDKYAHRDVMLHCFESIYPRMAKNAVCILMDYYDPEENAQGIDINPGVKLAFDIFFKDKPEKIVALFGEMYNHAYFRKM